MKILQMKYFDLLTNALILIKLKAEENLNNLLTYASFTLFLFTLTYFVSQYET